MVFFGDIISNILTDLWAYFSGTPSVHSLFTRIDIYFSSNGYILELSAGSMGIYSSRYPDLWVYIVDRNAGLMDPILYAEWHTPVSTTY